MVFIPDQGQLYIQLNQTDPDSRLCYVLSPSILSWLHDNVARANWYCDQPRVCEASGVNLEFDDICDEISFKLRWMS